MRPIKFRIWHGSKFVTYSDTYIRTSDGSLWYSEEDYGGTFSSHEKLYSFDGKIQQYTGLKDKNGKEIYEGDILDIFNHPQPEEVIYCSSETAFGFFAHEEKERQNGRFEYLGDYTSSSGYTVIGNIFENPELLDKTKEL